MQTHELVTVIAMTLSLLATSAMTPVFIRMFMSSAYSLKSSDVRPAMTAGHMCGFLIVLLASSMLISWWESLDNQAVSTLVVAGALLLTVTIISYQTLLKWMAHVSLLARYRFRIGLEAFVMALRETLSSVPYWLAVLSQMALLSYAIHDGAEFDKYARSFAQLYLIVIFLLSMGTGGILRYMKERKHAANVARVSLVWLVGNSIALLTIGIGDLVSIPQ